MKNILVGPKVTEKSLKQVADAKYTFEVNKTANKAQIAKAVSEFYKVKVESVKTMNVSGKIKNYKGKVSGVTKSYKKAIVKLQKGQKISDFNVNN